HPESQEYPQGHGWKPHDQRKVIEPVQPLKRREQPEDLSEPLGLELSELEQVQGRRDERQREQREPKNANGDVQQGPPAPTHGEPRLGPEPDQQRERDEARRQRPGEQRDRRGAEHAL